MPKKSGHNPASVRINNRKMVLNVIRNSQDVTVTQIAKEIQLSKTTLWKIIDHFQEQKLIINSGKAKSSDEGGKKPELYRFNASYAYVITIAIYEKMILLALTDTKACIFYKETIFLNENEKLNKIIKIITAFIRKWQEPLNLPEDRKESKLLGIAIASSGVIDFQSGVCFTASRFHSWPAEAPIKDMILNEVELQAPFYIDNYNRYFAFAEKTLGGFNENKNIVDIVTTHGGLGAGIIAEDNIKRGPRFLTGEIGHMRLDPYCKEACHCGGHGCFEQLVSSDVIIEKARNMRDRHNDSGIYFRDKPDISLQRIFDAADAGDEWGMELLGDIVKWFAIGIQNIVLVFNPEVVIISGDYRTAGPFFREKLNEMIENMSLTRMKKNIKIKYSKFDEEGALLGAASYVLHDYFNNRYEY